MKTELFAIFDKRGFVRATKRRAERKGNEIGVMIDVEIPDRAFDDGHIHASIAVPDDAFVVPQAIATVADVEPMEQGQ